MGLGLKAGIGAGVRAYGRVNDLRVVRSFSRLDQFLCMTVAPETARALVFLAHNDRRGRHTGDILEGNRS